MSFSGAPASVGERHPVAGADVGVGGVGKHPAASAGADDHRLGRDHADLAGLELDRDHAAYAVALDHQLGDEGLVVARERVAQRGLEERVQHVEAGLVGGEPRAHLLHPAERAHRDLAVVAPAPRAAPVLQPQQLLGDLVDEDLDAVLVAQPVAARDGVVGVLVERVVLGDYAGGAAFGGHGVAAHRVDLGDHRDAELGVDFGNGDRGAQRGAAATDQKNIMRRRFHGCFRPRPAPPYDKRRYFSIRYSYKPHFNPGYLPSTNPRSQSAARASPQRPQHEPKAGPKRRKRTDYSVGPFHLPTQRAHSWRRGAQEHRR